MKFIVLLRGINVGGKNKLPMAELKDMLTQNGFFNVETYIQSGNVVLEAPADTSEEIKNKIKTQIQKTFGLNISVMVFDATRWKGISDANPLKVDYPIDQLHATICEQFFTDEEIQTINELKDFPNRIIANNQTVYLVCPDGYSKTRYGNTYLENLLKKPLTTRNWKTISQLTDMIQSE